MAALPRFEPSIVPIETMTILKPSLRRRGRDSNPRCSHPHNSLAGSPIQPLSHLSKSARKFPNPFRSRFSNPSCPQTEGVGFEPTVGCPTPVFKTGSLNHSVTPPYRLQKLADNAVLCQSTSATINSQWKKSLEILPFPSNSTPSDSRILRCISAPSG